MNTQELSVLKCYENFITICSLGRSSSFRHSSIMISKVRCLTTRSLSSTAPVPHVTFDNGVRSDVYTKGKTFITTMQH